MMSYRQISEARAAVARTIVVVHILGPRENLGSGLLANMSFTGRISEVGEITHASYHVDFLASLVVQGI